MKQNPTLLDTDPSTQFVVLNYLKKLQVHASNNNVGQSLLTFPFSALQKVDVKR